MDPLKEAFSKVKQDIDSLKTQMDFLLSQVEEIKRTLNTPAHNQKIPSISSPESDISTDTPAHNLPLQALKTPNTDFSTGNRGVPADRQTDRQTDQHTQKFAQSHSLSSPSDLEKVGDILDSLDSIKKEIRKQFKRLTAQEMLIFETIYSLEESGLTVDYSLISQNLNLTESSIRDYVQKIMKKGIPVVKTKENNKKIILSISKDLKRIASLQTIQKLRDI